MQRIIKTIILLVAVVLPTASFAQLINHPDKFLGNITTRGSVDAGGGLPKFYELWNQITCENESKWQSVEGSSRGNFNWGCDNAFKYAKQHNFTYKFHALVWGSQYPTWIESLSYADRNAAIVEWYDAVQEKYPDLPMIDVVNEAVEGHQSGTHYMKEALGGGGKTGYDWLIKAFDMAYERWPNTILIYNDFNTFQWNTDQFIDLVRTLRDAGAPIDAYGCQSHDLTDCDFNKFEQSETKLQNALKMPMYSTEYDIGTDNDNLQLQRYKEQIPYMWEKPYCAGITLWGYVYGATWTTNGNSGLYKNGAERPAMTWLKKYMASDEAKNAVSPFPGMKKEASIYIRPAALKVAKDDVLPIKIHARLATKTIEKVDFYVDDELVQTMTEAPYIVEYTASTVGDRNTKAVVTATDGSTYERYGRFKVSRGTKRSPYNETIPQIPGTINVTEYDNGMSGVSYFDASRSSTYTKDGQWMEYTVDVQEEGYYTMIAEVASAKTGGIFHLSEYSLDKLSFFTDFTEVPNTGGTSQYQTLRCPMKEYLTAGRHVFCLNIDKGGFYIKSLTFKHTPTFSLPGLVEAEDYFLSSDGINIIDGNGGYVINNTKQNVWTEYLVDITQIGKYSYEATVSSDVDGSKVAIKLIENNGNEKSLSTITVPNTGSKNVYQVKTGTIRNALKEEGIHKLRFIVTAGNCNIDKVNLICTEPYSGISEVMSEDTSDAPAYNLMGVPVGEGYRGMVIKNGKKMIVK